MDLQTLITKYIGTSPTAYMVLGVAALIAINLILTVWLAAKSKTVQFSMLADFVTPTLTHSLFLVTMSILGFASKGSMALSTMFGGVQALGFAAVLLTYGYQIYEKLKQLGMKLPAQIDILIENKLSTITGGLIAPPPIAQPVHSVLPVAEPITVKPTNVPEEDGR